MSAEAVATEELLLDKAAVGELLLKLTSQMLARQKSPKLRGAFGNVYLYNK